MHEGLLQYPHDSWKEQRKGVIKELQPTETVHARSYPRQAYLNNVKLTQEGLYPPTRLLQRLLQPRDKRSGRVSSQPNLFQQRHAPLLTRRQCKTRDHITLLWPGRRTSRKRSRYYDLQGRTKDWAWENRHVKYEGENSVKVPKRNITGL